MTRCIISYCVSIQRASPSAPHPVTSVLPITTASARSESSNHPFGRNCRLAASAVEGSVSSGIADGGGEVQGDGEDEEGGMRGERRRERRGVGEKAVRDEKGIPAEIVELSMVETSQIKTSHVETSATETSQTGKGGGAGSKRAAVAAAVRRAAALVGTVPVKLKETAAPIKEVPGRLKRAAGVAAEAPRALTKAAGEVGRKAGQRLTQLPDSVFDLGQRAGQRVKGRLGDLGGPKAGQKLSQLPDAVFDLGQRTGQRVKGRLADMAIHKAGQNSESGAAGEKDGDYSEGRLVAKAGGVTEGRGATMEDPPDPTGHSQETAAAGACRAAVVEGEEWEERRRGGASWVIDSSSSNSHSDKERMSRHRGMGGRQGERWSGSSAGISEETVREALEGAAAAACCGVQGLQPLPAVVSRVTGAAEVVLTARQYVARMVSDARVLEGRQVMEAHRKLLAEIEEIYGVPANVMTALWGIESRYCNEPRRAAFFREELMEALSILENNHGPLRAAHSHQRDPFLLPSFFCLQPRRAAFFREELMEALSILENNHGPPVAIQSLPAAAAADTAASAVGERRVRLLGSYAGAMGQCQFMPSSFKAYAVDYDGDGRRGEVGELRVELLGSYAGAMGQCQFMPSSFKAYAVDYDGDGRRGAMGQCQFMPSSFKAYAVDYNGDGRRDIWTSIPDVLASMANYLKCNRWKRGEPVGVEVVLPPDFPPSLLKPAVKLTVAEWQQKHGIAPDGPAGVAYLACHNFHVILRYNPAKLYGLAIAELARRLG
ncbi:unnamed protein product [Closterium sp. Naga37s-1]|nr:unnamed protein product [Closterium sp. Naga37s-1]